MELQEQALLIGALMKSARLTEVRIADEDLIDPGGEVMTYRDPATLEWVFRYRPEPTVVTVEVVTREIER